MSIHEKKGLDIKNGLMIIWKDLKVLIYLNIGRMITKIKLKNLLAILFPFLIKLPKGLVCLKLFIIMSWNNKSFDL